MNLYRLVPAGTLLPLSVALFLGATPSAHANVYATNIKLNGGLANCVVGLGDSVVISYVLNEPASAGATVTVLSGATAVRTFTLAANAPGTLRGVNSVTWDGKDAGGNTVALGLYSVKITAAATGYTNWTALSDDGPNFNVWDGRGLAVNRNPNSPYFGRVFLANAAFRSPVGTVTGEDLGIWKWNADGSPADDGNFSTGGLKWSGGGLGPWKLEVSGDDFLYALDTANGGAVYRFDQAISTNSGLAVLRADNVPASASLAGLAVTGTGTNTQLWLADGQFPGSQGILEWSVDSTGVCASNDTGVVAVALGTGTNLTLYPTDVALGSDGSIYTCQSVFSSGDSAQRVFQFPAYASLAATNANWAVGGGDDTFGQATGLAVDPTGAYLAVSFLGTELTYPDTTNGCTRILYTTNGALAADIDLGLTLSGEITHQDTDCAWDAVGNLYFIDNYIGRWRIFSPPGANQSTTVAAPSIQVGGLPEPQITQITVSGGFAVLTFSAAASDSPGSFTVYARPSVTVPFTQIQATITNVSTGVFRAVCTVSGDMQFFQVQRIAAPPERPQITAISVAAGTVTLRFSGAAADPAAAFSVLSATMANGTFSTVPAATPTNLAPGQFQATFPTNGPAQFYKIQR